MKSAIKYVSDVVNAIKALAVGMRLTGSYFVRPGKILTQQYPENRDKLYIPERFRAQVVMPHDSNNEHLCTGCTLCEIACPNGSIKIITKTVEKPDGKPGKAIDQWVYNLGMCTMCAQCVDACPQNAIKMDNTFELSVYNRSRLIYQLNKPGSKLKEKQ